MLIIDVDNCGGKDADGNKLRVNSVDYVSLQGAMTLLLIRDFAAAIWTTPSHTAEWHRYRALFPLPDIYDSPADFSRLLKSFAKQIFPYADSACFDIARLFYGNTKADFWLNDGGAFRKFTPPVLTSEYNDVDNLLRYFKAVQKFPKAVTLPDGSELPNVGMFVRQTLWAMQGEKQVSVALLPNIARLSALRQIMERGAQ